MRNYFGKIILGIITIFSCIFGIIFNFKIVCLFIGSFSLLMFINISFTSLCNALVGREITVENDVFWKMVFILLTCIFYCLFFSL